MLVNPILPVLDALRATLREFDHKPESEYLRQEKAILLQNIDELERLSNSGCADSPQKVERE